MLDTRSRFVRVAAPLTLFAGAFAVASCSGGGGVTSTPQSKPSVAASASPAATSATASVAVPAAGGSVTLPTVASLASTLSFGTVPSGTTLNTTVSTTAPTGAPATSAHRSIKSGVAGGVSFFYITFTTNEGFSASVLTGESVTVPSSVPSGASIYAELDDLTSSVDIADFGPATVSGGIATVSNTVAGLTLPTLTTTDTYLIQFYYVAAGGSSPSPSASATASSAPSSSPSTSPSSGASSAPSSSASPGTSPSPSSSSLPEFTMSGGNDSCETAPTNGCGPVPNGAYLAVSLSNGVTVEPGFGTASAPSPSPLFLYFQAAANTSQISPSSSFPAFTGTGTVEAYFALNASTNSTGGNTPAGSVSYAQTPTIAVEGLPGSVTSGCALYGYTNNNGLTTAWNQIAPASGVSSVSAGAVTIQPVTLSGGIQVNATQFLGAIACQ